jgi:hypothetical protein
LATEVGNVRDDRGNSRLGVAGRYGGDSAASRWPAVIPAGVGVNIHFVTGHARDLGLITTAGFRFVGCLVI